VTVTVNGRVHELEDGETVARMLERLGVPGRFALVERNGEPVGRGDYAEVELESGDTLVVARPVAGG
jgi:thiamine biosynthesis protein ThiS